MGERRRRGRAAIGRPIDQGHAAPSFVRQPPAMTLALLFISITEISLPGTAPVDNVVCKVRKDQRTEQTGRDEQAGNNHLRISRRLVG